MRLTKKKVEEILQELLGPDSPPLVKELYDRQNISEFDLAHKTKKDIKIIRRMLYILYNHNLVSFTRKKDKEKGWYIYYWTLSPESIRFLYFKKKREHLQQSQQRLEQEHKELFFVCPKKCVRLNFDQATDFEFHCPECGELSTPDSSADKIVLLKKDIAALQSELKLDQQEQDRTTAKRKVRLLKKTKEKPVVKVKKKKKK